MLRTALILSFILPLAAQEPVTRIACGSCYKPAKEKGIWEYIAQDKPEAFLFMGDNLYADTTDMEKMRKKYTRLVTLPSYVKFSKNIPIIPTWDDHDYGKNDAGREFPKRVEAQKIFLDSYRFPDDHPARHREGIYHRKVLGPEGKQIRIIMLDTRYHRSPLIQKKVNLRKRYFPQNDPKATMLGDEQWKWLEEELKKPAELRIIVSSIQLLMTDHRFEKWSNIPAERARFLTLLKTTKAGPTILLSGDRHLAEVCRLTSDATGLPYDLYEMTSSGMTHAGSGFYESKLRVPGTHYNKKNYGLLEIDWSGPSPQVDLIIKSWKNSEISRTPVNFTSQ